MTILKNEMGYLVLYSDINRSHTTWFTNEEVYKIVRSNEVVYFSIHEYFDFVAFGHDDNFYVITRVSHELKCVQCLPFWNPSREVDYIVRRTLTFDELKWFLSPEKYEEVIWKSFKLI